VFGDSRSSDVSRGQTGVGKWIGDWRQHLRSGKSRLGIVVVTIIERLEQEQIVNNCVV
jgi:hypothetical protein